MLPTEQANDVAELELRDYLSVIWRRRRVVILCLIVTVGAAIAYSVSRPAVYRADAELLLETRVLDPLGESSRPADAERLLNNEIRVIESSAVVDAVDDAYDGPLDPDDLNAGIASSTSDAIKLSITGRDPEATADLVNVYADTYVEYRLAQQVGELLAAGAEIQPQIDELHQRIAATRAPLTALEAEIAAIDPESRGAADAVADLEARHDQLASELQPQLAPLQNQLSFYQQQLDELEVSAGVTQRGGPKILQRATVPESPVSPRPTRDAVIAAFLGLLLGLGLAFLVDHLDLSLKTKEDVETVARDVPTLGLIPRMEDWKNESEARLARRGTGASEAYRALRTSVKFAGLERKLNVIQVTSPGANEGKTTTLANLAVVLAEAGDRVCVVCCDLRHPRIQDFFHAELAPGFTSALLGDIELELVVQRLLDNNRLYLLPAGPKAPNPSELLSLNRAEAIVKSLADQFDVVLVDTPPVLPVTDALVVSRFVDATILVALSGKTSKRELTRTLELLRQVSAPVLGTVLNGVDEGMGYGYGEYGYYRALAKRDKPGKLKRRERRRQRRDTEAPAPLGRPDERGWRRDREPVASSTPEPSTLPPPPPPPEPPGSPEQPVPSVERSAPRLGFDEPHPAEQRPFG